MAAVEIGGRVFRPRRLTGRALLQVQAAEQDAEDAGDIRAGLEVEMHHLAVRMEKLADADGDFDTAERDRLTEERKGLRRRVAQAREDELRAQMLIILARCEPVDGVDVDWCLDHMEFPGDLQRILGGDDEDPPVNSGEPSGTR